MHCCFSCFTTYPPNIVVCPKDGSKVGEQLDPYLGKLAGSYHLVELLATGGMGFVYRAEHKTLQKEVAIKLIRPELTQRKDLSARFLAEARIISQLNHEHIVDILDVGMLEGEAPYFVMEFLEGESLGRLLEKNKRLSPERTIHILVQLLDALSTAHQNGFIHRDLKPENVFLLQRRGQPFVKLLDFGIAKFLDPQLEVHTQTSNGGLLGTPHYMSPEQIQGHSQEIDARSDLYSVGILLFECLSGQLPFEGKSFADYVIAHVMNQPPKVTQIAADIPPALSAITQKALQKKQGDRYQSAAEMSAALQAATLKLEVTPPTVKPHSKMLWYAAGACVLVFTLMALLLSFGASPQTKTPAPIMRSTPEASPLSSIQPASVISIQPTSTASTESAHFAEINLSFHSRPKRALVMVSIEGKEQNLGTTPTTLRVAKGSNLSVLFTKGNLRAQKKVVAARDQLIMGKLVASIEPRKKRTQDKIKKSNKTKDPGNGTIPFGGK
jgi:serine/threonine protein kinase